MPTKAFLHKKSLLDQFKDDYKSTGYIQSARAEHTWNNPLTRRKRTNKLNRWIKSFQGKRHIHKLARFNAQQAGKNEDASSNLYVAYHISPTKFEKFHVMPKSGMGTNFYGRGIYLTYDKSVIDHYKNLLADYYDNLYIYTVLISPKAKIISEDEIFDYIDDSVDLEDSARVAGLLKNKVDGIRYYNDEDGNSVVIFNADLVSIKSRQEYSMKNEAMSLKGFLSNIGDKLANKYGLDKNKVQNYLGSHTQEMQELLDDKELSLKEKVLFVRDEITGGKDEAKQNEVLVLPNPTIIYKGPIEDAKKACSYVSKILADKGLGLGRVCWRGPKNGEFHYGHPEKDVYTVCLRGSNDLIKDSFAVYRDAYGNDFWNNCDADPRGWVDPLTINRYDVATPRQESKKHEFYMDDDESEDYYYCQRCGRVTPSYELDAHGGFCSDCDARWTAEHENESKDTDEKLGYEKGHKNSKGENAPWVIRSHEDNRVLASFANENDAKEHLKRMKQYSKQEAYVDNSDTAQKDYVERVISAIQDYYGYSLFNAKNLVQSNYKKVLSWFESGNVDAVEAARCLGDNCEPTKKSESEGNKDVFTIELYRIYDDGEEDRIDDMQATQIFYDEDEAIKVANELADSYADDAGVVFAVVMAGEREKPNGNIVGEPFDIHWASSSNPEKTAEYRKKAGYAAFDNAMDYYAKQNESKKFEGIHLDFEDTIRVPEWLWKAYMLNDTTDLEEDEIEKLNGFREKYKNYHLDDKSNDPYFSSRNDFDELGGNVYDVDVYKMSDEPTEKKNENKNEALKDFPDGTNYKFTFGFHSPKTANIAKNAAEKNGYVATSDKDNNVSVWTKDPQDAIRFADTTVSLANEDERTKLERSDVDKDFAIAIKNKDYSENKETIDNATTEYAVVVHPFESFDGFSVMGELTDVVDFLEAIK